MAKIEFERASGKAVPKDDPATELAVPARIPSAVDRRVGDRLRTARQAQGLSLLEVAKNVGLSPQQIQKYEIGVSRISAARLYQLATLYARPVEWFFEGD